MQGAYMYITSRPTLRTCNTIMSGKIEDGPANLDAAGVKPQDPKLVHKKTIKFSNMAVSCIVLLFLAQGLRILITYDVLAREKRIVTAYEAMVNN